jgi:hypothetical protein
MAKALKIHVLCAAMSRADSLMDLAVFMLRSVRETPGV